MRRVLFALQGPLHPPDINPLAHPAIIHIVTFPHCHQASLFPAWRSNLWVMPILAGFLCIPTSLRVRSKLVIMG